MDELKELITYKVKSIPSITYKKYESTLSDSFVDVTDNNYSLYWMIMNFEDYVYIINVQVNSIYYF